MVAAQSEVLARVWSIIRQSEEDSMSSTELMHNAQFLVDEQGRRTAVMVDIKVWDALMDLLEDLEDMQLVKDAMSRLEQGPEAAGALDWETARDEL
jgi:predicted DNA-binding protein